MTTPTEEAEEVPAEPLKFKRWVLKVSIHCEGCKRKVKKVLHSVEGVYTVDIEAKQHRVTVHGDVEADALIKKLIKSGKQAALWPEQPEQKEKKSGKAKNKEKQSNAAEDSVQGGSGDKEKQPAVKFVQDPSESSAAVGLAKNGEGGGSPVKNSEGGGAAKISDSDRKIGGGAVKLTEPDRKIGGGAVKFTEPDSKIGGGEQTKESKSEGNKPENSSAAVEKKDGECDGDGGAEKNGGKKKKKKGQSGGEGEASSSGVPGSPRPTIRSYGPPQGDQSPPRLYGYHQPPHYHVPPPHPPHYHVPPPPVCAVSYSTSYPTPSYTMSYHAAPPPNSYAYSYPRFETEPPPSDWESHPHQPSDSFGFLSDENPNACAIM